MLGINYAYPWAHRTNTIRTLKGLEDTIQLVELDAMDPPLGKGWYSSGKTGPDQDPFTGARYLSELYLRDDSNFPQRPTVPVLWDSKSGI